MDLRERPPAQIFQLTRTRGAERVLMINPVGNRPAAGKAREEGGRQHGRLDPAQRLDTAYPALSGLRHQEDQSWGIPLILSA